MPAGPVVERASRFSPEEFLEDDGAVSPFVAGREYEGERPRPPQVLNTLDGVVVALQLGLIAFAEFLPALGIVAEPAAQAPGLATPP